MNSEVTLDVIISINGKAQDVTKFWPVLDNSYLS